MYHIEVDIFQFIWKRFAYARPLARYIQVPGWKHVIGRIWWKINE